MALSLSLSLASNKVQSIWRFISNRLRIPNIAFITNISGCRIKKPGH